MWGFASTFILQINPLNASVALIYKPVNWFTQQINWLVSIWGQHFHLMGLKVTEELVEDCLLTRWSRRTSAIIFGQWHGFSLRLLTSAIFIERFCLFTSLLDCEGYEDVIRCSVLVVQVVLMILILRIQSLDHFIWILNHPWRQISLYKNCAAAKAFLFLTGLVCVHLANWSMQTMEL